MCLRDPNTGGLVVIDFERSKLVPPRASPAEKAAQAEKEEDQENAKGKASALALLKQERVRKPLGDITASVMVQRRVLSIRKAASFSGEKSPLATVFPAVVVERRVVKEVV